MAIIAEIETLAKNTTLGLKNLFEKSENSIKLTINKSIIEDWANKIGTEAKDIERLTVSSFTNLGNQIYVDLNYVIQGIETRVRIIHDIPSNATSITVPETSAASVDPATVAVTAEAPAPAMGVAAIVAAEPEVNLDVSDLVASNGQPVDEPGTPNGPAVFNANAGHMFAVHVSAGDTFIDMPEITSITINRTLLDLTLIQTQRSLDWSKVTKLRHFTYTSTGDIITAIEYDVTPNQSVPIQVASFNGALTLSFSLNVSKTYFVPFELAKTLAKLA